MARLFSITRCDVLTLTLDVPFPLSPNTYTLASRTVFSFGIEIVVIIMHPTVMSYGRGDLWGRLSVDHEDNRFLFNRPVPSRGGWDMTSIAT